MNIPETFKKKLYLQLEVALLFRFSAFRSVGSENHL